MKVHVKKARAAPKPEEIETDELSVVALLDLLFTHLDSKGDATEAGKLASASAIAARLHELPPERFERYRQLAEPGKRVVESGAKLPPGG